MKYIFYMLCALCLAASACATKTASATVEDNTTESATVPADDAAKSPVLVELFTSEGCSSCPPAERALAFLDKEQPYMQAEIITLALHVDYWNRLGWKDEFSSPLYSRRQQLYASKFRLDSEYTPQMVVDGAAEFNGSDLGKASKAIIAAAKAAKAKITLAADGDKLKINIAEIPERKESATVYVAFAEGGLVSNIKRGENAGQNLTHESVVRDLQAVASVPVATNSLTVETTLPYRLAKDRKKTKAVVFIQLNESRKIIAAAQIFCGQNI